MPKISKAEVARIADLARLAMSDAELSKATENLKGILNHFSAIQNIDTNGIPTADDSSGLVSVAREDVSKPEELATHTSLLAAMPEKNKGHMQVKAIFSNE